jgi:hypothetical protein
MHDYDILHYDTHQNGPQPYNISIMTFTLTTHSKTTYMIMVFVITTFSIAHPEYNKHHDDILH